jgi:Tfp pilus assembly protein PilO
MRWSPAWRDRWWTWALPLALVVLNATILAVHPGRTGAGFAEMERSLETETRALAALSEKEAAVTRVLADARSSRQALDDLYRERFATQAERLTRLITEVKRLGLSAGLEPASISYPEESIDEYGLVRMSLVFTVKGSYPQLRTFINLLEVSDLFLVLERVGLSNAQDSTLGINLQISTFFVREPDPGPAGRGRPVERGPES